MRPLKSRPLLVQQFDRSRAVLQGFEEGRYRPFVDRVFALEDVAQAHRYLEDRRQRGKVVVSIPEAATT